MHAVEEKQIEGKELTAIFQVEPLSLHKVKVNESLFAF